MVGTEKGYARLLLAAGTATHDRLVEKVRTSDGYYQFNSLLSRIGQTAPGLAERYAGRQALLVEEATIRSMDAYVREERMPASYELGMERGGVYRALTRKERNRVDHLAGLVLRTGPEEEELAGYLSAARLVAKTSLVDRLLEAFSGGREAASVPAAPATPAAPSTGRPAPGRLIIGRIVDDYNASIATKVRGVPNLAALYAAGAQRIGLSDGAVYQYALKEHVNGSLARAAAGERNTLLLQRFNKDLLSDYASFERDLVAAYSSATTVQEAVRTISQQYGMRISESHLRRLARKAGVARRKARSGSPRAVAG